MTTNRSLSNHCRVTSFCLSKGIFSTLGYGAILFVLILMLCLAPAGVAPAQMSPLNNEDLRGITGQAGVSINMEGSAQIRMDLFRFSDTQTTPNWIELHDLNVDNGYGGPFLFSTPVIDINTFVTYYTTYYSALAAAETDLDLKAVYEAKALYTWTANQNAMLTDAKVLDGTIATVMDPITIDVATDSGGTTYVNIRETSSINPRRYSVGSLVFSAYNATKNSVAVSNAISTYMTVNNILTNADLILALTLGTAFNYMDSTTWTASDLAALALAGDSNLATKVATYQTTPIILQTQPLGSITLDALRQGPSVSRFWAHAGQGISFDYATAISADALTYAYNTNAANGFLKLSKINIAGLATGDPSDPYDANSSGDPWAFSGNFKIGTIDTANTPATMDVGTDSSNVTSVYMSLPMAGSIRVAEVNFGGNNFGPIAIDGIQFHRLELKISP